MGGAHEDVVSVFDKPGRENVPQEPADKLRGGDGHQPLVSGPAVVPGSEGDRPLDQAHQSMVNDGHPVGVAAEVMIGLGGAAESPLGVDDPLFSSEFPEEALELHRVFKTGNLAPQSALTESLLQGLQKLASDDLGEGPDGEEEAVSGCDPSAAIRAESPARDHQVQMGMKVEVLIPGVQDCSEAHLGPQALIISGKLEESLGGALKEEIEHE